MTPAERLVEAVAAAIATNRSGCVREVGDVIDRTHAESILAAIEALPATVIMGEVEEQRGCKWHGRCVPGPAVFSWEAHVDQERRFVTPWRPVNEEEKTDGR